MSDVSDFDFWMGDWTVQNRRLRERLAGSDEWEEFEAESKAWPILGGLGNEDTYRTDHDGGFELLPLVRAGQPLPQPPVLHLPLAHPEVEVADVAHRIAPLVAASQSLEKK